MFKTFPEFSRLALSDRAEYEAFIKSYPPVSDLSFTTLITWWSMYASVGVAWLNNNLVISYWIPGDEESSGLALVGGEKIDESICTIFDYLKEKGEPPRLVHISEFVLSAVRYPELFNFSGMRDYDEYIVPVSALYPLESATSPLRFKVRKLQGRLQNKKVLVKSIDLSSHINQGLLLASAKKWWEAEGKFRSPKMAEESMALAITGAEALAVQSVCLYIDGQLVGFYLYQATHDPECVIANYSSCDPGVVGLAEYLEFVCCKFLAEKGVQYINLDSDLGSHFYRSNHLSIGPANYFRKYAVEPAHKEIYV